MDKKLHSLFNNECRITIRLLSKPTLQGKSGLLSFIGVYKDTERYKVIVSPSHDDAYMVARHLIEKGDYVDIIGKIKLIAPKSSSDMPHHNMLAAHKILYRNLEFKSIDTN